jgi:hypothetical protein
MILEFVVIPYNSKCEEYANSLINMLNKCKNISVTLDTNYNQSVNSRQNKYKVNEKNIILVDDICIVNNEIIVKYSDKGSRAKRYNKDEFSELLLSFYSTTTDEIKDLNKDENDFDKPILDDNEKDDSTDGGGCIIM